MPHHEYVTSLLYKKKTPLGFSLALSASLGIINSIFVLGWILDIKWLIDPFTSESPTKLIAAISFVCVSIIILSLSYDNNARPPLLTLIHIAVTMLFIHILAIIIFGFVTQINTGAEFIFTKNSSNTSFSDILVQKQSIGTAFSFSLICAIAIQAISGKSNYKFSMLIVGNILCLIGLTAVTGYIIGVPVLYFDIQGVSSPMSIYTGVSLIVSGAAMLASGRIGDH